MSDNIKSSGPVNGAEQAEAYLAWKRGEPVECWGSDRWWPMTGGMNLTQETILRRKPAPKLRPWTGDEVPLGAWMRAKVANGSDFVTTIVSKSNRNLWLGGADIGLDFAEALRDYEHSNDFGLIWSPCGRQE